MKNEITRQIFNIVKQCVDEWDPYGLLKSGCPSDEFDIESVMISQEITPATSKDRIIEVVSSVFSDQFESQYFGIKDCEEVGTKIYASLSELK